MMRSLLLSLLLLSTSAAATSFKAPLPLDELALNSQAVVRGTVINAVLSSNSHGLQTTYTVEVNETLSGHSQPTVQITLPGGVDGDLRQTFVSVPLWQLGEEVLLFTPAEGQPISLRGLFTVRGEALIDPLAHRAIASPKTVEALQTVVGDLSL